MTSQIMLSSPRNPPPFTAALQRFLTHGSCTEGRHVFAYVSLAGIEDSIGRLATMAAYAGIPKHWIVGIHNAITEPVAIDLLVSSPGTSIRVFSSSGKIDLAALSGAEKLHAKTVYLNGKNEDLIVVGSSNMTRAALGTECTNYEAMTSVTLAIARERKSFVNWFDGIWRLSLPVNASLIDKYSTLRDEFIKTNRVVLPRLDEMPLAAISRRSHLWIEAGAMSGGDRNQIEFGPSLAPMFGPLRRGSVNLRLRWRGHEYGDRPLSYKVTQWGTEIWRFSLITSNQGGPAYPGKIIHFTRQTDETGEYFVLDVASPGSAKASEWRRLAGRVGTIAWTGLGAGREYGVY